MKIFSLLIGLFLGIGFFITPQGLVNAADCNVDYCVSSNISSNTTWATTTAEYVVQSWVTINSGVTLTINPGVIVKFEANTGLYVSGTLDAQGTSGSRIHFTSIKDDTVGGDTNGDGSGTSPAAGNWEVIKTNSGGSTLLTYATIRYAGAAVFGNWFFATLYNNGGTFSISSTTIASSTTHILHNVTGTTTIANSDIDDATSYGLRIENGALTVSTSTIREHSYGIAAFGGALTVNGNTFSDNSTYPGFINLASVYAFNASGNTSAVTGAPNGFQMDGTLVSSMTWSKDTMPYLMTNTVTVPSGKTLTIKPGAVIKGDTNSARLTVEGTLSADGTGGDPIYFTSIKDDSILGDTNGDSTGTSPAAADWDAIRLNSGSNTVIVNAVIRYGGKNFSGGLASNIYNDGGDLTVEGTQIASSTSYGIFQSSGTLIAKTVDIRNQSSGIYQNGGSSLVHASSTIHHNTEGINISGGTHTVEGILVKDNTTGLFLNNASNAVQVNQNYIQSNVDGIYVNSGTTTLTIIATNHILNNSDTGIQLSSGSTNALVVSNYFSGNTNYAVKKDTWAGPDTDTTAHYNYWGASNGPSGGECGACSGSGDKASAQVDASPYLNAMHYVQAAPNGSLTWNSVDRDGGLQEYIRYTGTVTAPFNDEWSDAIDIWNNQGPVWISGTTTAVSKIMAVATTSDSSSFAVGTWEHSVSTSNSTTTLNTYYMGTNRNKDVNAIAHELGHALGLHHSYPGNIMNYIVTGLTSLGWQDLEDLEFCWDDNICDP